MKEVAFEKRPYNADAARSRVRRQDMGRPYIWNSPLPVFSEEIFGRKLVLGNGVAAGW